MLTALETGVKGGKWYSLIDKVVRPETLRAAWESVRRNKGAAGVDGQTVHVFEGRAEREIQKLSEELREGRYEPKLVRRVYIDKPGSQKKRPLGIPVVRDRVVQAALRYAIEPIFEKEFVDRSYGFRPGRGCKDALRQVESLLRSGATHVVDLDIEGYFDAIPRERLLEEVQRKIADGRVLALVDQYLRQGVLEDGRSWEPESGTPQGAVISPLLGNIYLHPVDVVMAEAGWQMVRYADDMVILCRSREEAEAALKQVRALLEARGLRLSEEKTRIADEQREGFAFLGYHFEGGTRWPRKTSLKKLKEAIRAKTKRSNGHSLEQIITEVNQTVKGWFEYFRHSRRWTFSPVDGWIRMRLRSILRKRMRKRGRGRGDDHKRWPNSFFRERGLFIMSEASRLNR
jgi:RNA-directed DNA polymerase